MEKQQISKPIKSIAVLTSGGDAPGMNAVIRSVVRTGLHYGYRVYGVKRGYHGLWKGEFEEMTRRSVSEKLQRGGTFLMTARSATFNSPVGIEKAVNMCKVFDVDAVVACGGDGTFRGAKDLADAGIPVIGIPCTIDNDVKCSDYTIGYDTAMNTAVEAIDKLRDTASSHERCSVVEVMGRKAGYIALNVAIATGAEVCLLPELEYNFERDVVKPLLRARNVGKHHYIVLIAEGIGDSVEIARKIESEIEISARTTILGHLQRGGSPTVMDRYFASMMGAKAVEAIQAGRVNRLIAVQKGDIIDIDIEEALAMTKTIDLQDYERAKILAE